MALLSEESSQVVSVDSSVVVSVDRSVGSKRSEVVSNFKVSLEGVESSLEINFSLNDLNHSQFNVSGEVLVSAYSVRWSVESDVSKEVVFAWQNHLQVTIGK